MKKVPKSIISFPTFPIFLPPCGRWHSYFQSFIPLCVQFFHLTQKFFPTTGGIYFSAPLVLGLATWFALDLATWLAPAIAIEAETQWRYEMCFYGGVYSFVLPLFTMETTCLKKLLVYGGWDMWRPGPRWQLGVKSSWAQPGSAEPQLICRYKRET